MRILSITVYPDDNNINIEFRIIKQCSLQPKRKLHCHVLSPSELLACSGFTVEQFPKSFTEKKAGQPQFSLKKFIVSLPKEPLRVLHLLNKLEELHPAHQYDFILVNANETTPPFNVATVIDSPANTLIANKQVLPNNSSISDYLAEEIIKLDSSYRYLGLTLANGALTKQQKDELLDSIATLDNVDNPTTIGYDFMTKLHELLIDKLLRPCIGKKACDQGIYNNTYTELSLIKSAIFTQHTDGRLMFDLAANPAFAQYYAVGKANSGLLEQEMRYLGNIIGLAYASDCDFTKSIIFTPECSAKLLKKGVLFDVSYLEKYQQKHIHYGPILTNKKFVKPLAIGTVERHQLDTDHRRGMFFSRVAATGKLTSDAALTDTRLNFH